MIEQIYAQGGSLPGQQAGASGGRFRLH